MFIDSKLTTVLCIVYDHLKRQDLQLKPETDALTSH